MLKEFLNFCVSLTKELHLCHVVILSSNTIFINRISNDAKLKVTSRFYKIDHLDYKTTVEWLKEEEFTEEEIELIWDYLGGCIPLIQRMMRDKNEFKTLKEYLEYDRKLAVSEIKELMKRFMDGSQRKIFKDIAKVIIENVAYESKEDEEKEYLEVIDFMSEREIFFYEPIEQIVKGNNRLYEKGMEILINN